MEDEASGRGTLGGMKADAVLAAISSVKTEFSLRFDGLIAVIENMRREINDCTERVTLESENKTIEDKLLDLETRSGLNNLRLLEGA